MDFLPGAIVGGRFGNAPRALGLAAFSGMLGVTLFGVFLTPVFYYVIRGFGKRSDPDSARGENIRATASDSARET